MLNLVHEYESHLYHVQPIIEEVFQEVGQVIFAETDTTYHKAPTYVFGIHLHHPFPHQEVLYLDASTCYMMSSERLYNEARSICQLFKRTFNA